MSLVLLAQVILVACALFSTATAEYAKRQGYTVGVWWSFGNATLAVAGLLFFQ